MGGATEKAAKKQKKLGTPLTSFFGKSAPVVQAETKTEERPGESLGTKSDEKVTVVPTPPDVGPEEKARGKLEEDQTSKAGEKAAWGAFIIKTEGEYKLRGLPDDIAVG